MPEQVKKSLSALEWQCGRFDLALWLGSLGRLSLWPGLWCWRDLHAELAVRAPESAAHAATRFWRLAASALLLSEAALLGRLALALPTTAPVGPTALLALPGALGAAAASLSSGRRRGCRRGSRPPSPSPRALNGRCRAAR